MTTTTSETQASRERRRLLEKVGAWFDAMVKAQPNINDGDCYTLELTGGFCGYGNDDEPLFDVLLLLPPSRPRGRSHSILITPTRSASSTSATARPASSSGSRGTDTGKPLATGNARSLSCPRMRRPTGCADTLTAYGSRRIISCPLPLWKCRRGPSTRKLRMSNATVRKRRRRRLRRTALRLLREAWDREFSAILGVLGSMEDWEDPPD